MLWSACAIGSLTCGQSTLPLPPGTETVTVPSPPPRVVKPKQDTGNFAVRCPYCGDIEVVKAIKMQTNGGRLEGSYNFVQITVTAKCPDTKKKFQFPAERKYPVQTMGVEVDAKPAK